MNMLNSLILEGNVTRGLSDKPSCKDFEIEVIRYCIDTDGNKAEEKSYFTVELYSNMASSERIVRNLEIGRGIRIVGRIKQKRWNDEEGKEHSRVVVIAEHIEFKLKKQILPTE